MSILEKIKKDSTISSIILIGIILVIASILAFFWMDYDFNFTSKINSEKAGQFGDFVGGVAGSLWALAGVFLFYKALTEQRDDFKNNKKTLDLQVDALQQQIQEFKLSRQELISSRKVYEEQSKTLKVQQFESNFYSLLNVYLSIKNNLNLKKNNYFKQLVLKLDSAYDLKNDVIIQHDKLIEKYVSIFNEYREDLSHYFRAFYRIIKIIESNPQFSDEEKTFYSKIMRSQLTDNELIILYYNSYTVAGYKTRKYILKYNLLKHIPIFSKPEFKLLLNNGLDTNMILFSVELDSFLSKHIGLHYDVENDVDKMEEKFDNLDVIVGIYFSDNIEVKVYCDFDIVKNGILVDDNEFNDFLCQFFYDRLVFSNYIDPENVKLTKSKTEIENRKEFSILIETDESLKPNKDKY